LIEWFIKVKILGKSMHKRVCSRCGVIEVIEDEEHDCTTVPESTKAEKIMKHLKTTIKLGLVIGIPLAVLAFVGLTMVGNSAQRDIDREHQEFCQYIARLGDSCEYKPEQPENGLEAVDAKTVGTLKAKDSDRDTFNGEHEALQPVAGYRYLQPTYSPQETIEGQ
jgi:hypothetical protein